MNKKTLKLTTGAMATAIFGVLLLLNRQTDAGEEVAQGLAFGLNDTGGGRKQLYEVFKYIDTPNHAAYTDFAKEIIGISSWSEIIR